jgi:hypothetical protein
MTKHHRRALVVGAAVLLGAGSCTTNEPVIHKLKPDIVVGTLSDLEDTVDFGDVTVLYDDTQSFTVINAARGALKISDIHVEDNDDNVFTIEWDPVEAADLGEDESITVTVNFAPATYAVYERDLIIESNDENKARKKVHLIGEGVDGPIPDIAVDRLSVDFGDVGAFSTKTDWFTIDNVGDGDLVISTIGQSGSGAFTVVNGTGEQTISANNEKQVLIEYAPEVDSGDSATLTINSNDPDEAAVEVTLVGNGGSDDDYPIAVIDCDEMVRPLDRVDLDGRNSYDPGGGEIVKYEWTLAVQPSGSTSEVINDNTDYATLFIDTAGSWQVDLQVTNDVGLISAPAQCHMQAVPEDKIHVELSWDTGDTDLDLHLVQEGGSFFDSRQDCCWCNKNPNWGESGSSDDPLLALDNIVGYGPEDLTVDAPEDGDYHVKVHYFKDLQGSGNVTTATVKIYLNGVEVDGSPFGQTLTHNQVWDVGYIRWPSAVFAEVAVDTYAAGRRNCQ